jgi:predicted ribosome quality control (RQC) complex YloA/Tae2 family protein
MKQTKSIFRTKKEKIKEERKKEKKKRKKGRNKQRLENFMFIRKTSCFYAVMLVS